MISVDIAKKLRGSIGDMNLKINLNIKESEFLALAGESGSGKTTLLRVLAGLEKADGEIKIGDEVWLDSKLYLPPQKRGIGFLFQDYALFPNMTILQNLLYVNRDIKLANHLLEITELSEMSNRYPDSLSGGQKQRVSLSRAMMSRPKLLLLDEPLSALDPTMRSRLQSEILTLHREFKTTTIMVSHDPSEIYRMANRVVVLESGKIIKDGTPKETLLKKSGSQKFSFSGELLSIEKVDSIYVAVVSIGQQLVEVVITSKEAESLKEGDLLSVSTKAFSPIVKRV